jgi:acyl-CoA reductase-like NAD-dependent aldehyde dehydrogenase
MLNYSLIGADLAVKAARAAFESGPWSKFTGNQRRDLMLKLADLIEANADELAAAESRDNGSFDSLI